MKLGIILAASFLVMSCSQKPEEVNNFELPSIFQFQGIVSVERYSHGGALGGYRYYVYYVDLKKKRELLYTGKSNKLLMLSFPRDRVVLLDFCGPTPRQKKLSSLQKWRGVTLVRLC
jgi:hypothetical protein